MHTLLLLLVGSFCIAEVFPRHVLDDVSDPDLLTPDHDGVRKHASDQNRHRRRRWQSNYGVYDYPHPAPYPYYPERRDYDRNQQDLLPQIVKLLEEISSYVRRPQPAPPMPQPIYIPYPVPYPILQYSPCSENATKKPTITNRFPEMEDTNQNWGFVIPKDDNDDFIDGSRPISFEPIKPIRPMKRPPPSVEHGSSVGDSQHPSTEAPKFGDQPGAFRTPSLCNAAILSCCAGDKSQQKICFNGFQCGATYDNGNVCSEDSINAALESFKSAYAPVQ